MTEFYSQHINVGLSIEKYPMLKLHKRLANSPVRTLNFMFRAHLNRTDAACYPERNEKEFTAGKTEQRFKANSFFIYHPALSVSQSLIAFLRHGRRTISRNQSENNKQWKVGKKRVRTFTLHLHMKQLLLVFPQFINQNPISPQTLCISESSSHPAFYKRPFVFQCKVLRETC